MKRVSFLVLTGIFMISAISLNAQKLKSGDVKILKGQTTINLQYDYSNMAVGKYKSETDYVNEKVAEMNKKKAGSGDEWKGKWTSDRANRFQPMFERELNKEIKKNNVTAKENSADSKYTLIVSTTFTEPGFNAVVGGIRKNANVSLMVTLVETANPGSALADIEMKNVQSSSFGGYDYDTGGRIESAYNNAGEALGKFLNKNAYK